MLLSPVGRDGVGDGSPQCEFTFRGLFSRIIQPAHRLFVYRPFSPFWPFSLPRGRREDSLFAPSFSPGRAGEPVEGEKIVAIVARSGQKSL